VIKYSLSCDKGHAFEGWFSGGADFEQQLTTGLLSCPVCNSLSVTKALMAPAVSTARKQEEKQAMVMDMARREVVAKIREAVASIKANADDVGDRFPEEARKIHYGESDARGIIGHASAVDLRDLLEEGIEVAPLPVLPEDAN
jgi:hypothetical protein